MLLRGLVSMVLLLQALQEVGHALDTSPAQCTPAAQQQQQPMSCSRRLAVRILT